MSELSSPDGSRTSFSEKCSHNTCDDNVMLHTKNDSFQRSKQSAGMLVMKTKHAYQFSSKRLGISAKSPSRRRPENLEKVALFDIWWTCRILNDYFSYFYLILLNIWVDDWQIGISQNPLSSLKHKTWIHHTVMIRICMVLRIWSEKTCEGKLRLHTTWLNSWNILTTSGNRSNAGFPSNSSGHWDNKTATGTCHKDYWVGTVK